MKTASLVCFLFFTAGAFAKRETYAESAVHVRELISYRSYGIGTLMTTYPEGDKVGDTSMGSLPIGMQEYYAPFPGGDGDLLLLAMPIAKIFRNAMPPNAPNATITISDLYGLGDGTLAAGRMRVALFGTVEPVTKESNQLACRTAYLEAHPDARGWIPPNGPHSAFYARFRVEKVYAFDGFGDVSYIGWIDLADYRAAGNKTRSRKEVERNWREPVQPEPEFADYLFAESSIEEEGPRQFLVQSP
ncbi:pyridoxamine 5'-phosphate oxidase-domain-containing protein [Mycena crocata]|nr:pyridoxamine 5'-phosphate oxidase-domain-containing protein [Mycena crocata]